jgi:hypothetical protein
MKRDAFEFFRQNAGWSTPPGKLACAKALAEAEHFAKELGLEVKWEYEQEDWMVFAGDPEAEYRRNFKSGKWECFHAYVKGDGGEILSSLGGIILEAGDASYKRVIEAELYMEAIGEMKRGRP